MNELPKLFEQYLLENSQVSRNTLRNYRCDVAHFFEWAFEHALPSLSKADSWEAVLPHLSPSLVTAYKGWHIEKKIPASTANRRLSTLRQFSKFLKASGFIKTNPAEDISNLNNNQGLSTGQLIQKTLAEFTSHLKKEQVSAPTLKNYLSDIRQFFAWSNQNKQLDIQAGSAKSQKR